MQVMPVQISHRKATLEDGYGTLGRFRDCYVALSGRPEFFSHRMDREDVPQLHNHVSVYRSEFREAVRLIVFFLRTRRGWPARCLEDEQEFVRRLRAYRAEHTRLIAVERAVARAAVRPIAIKMVACG